jgi:hypothetical protein
MKAAVGNDDSNGLDDANGIVWAIGYVFKLLIFFYN